MMLTAYNPQGQASCRPCGRLTTCTVLHGNLAFSPRYMHVQCNECGRENRIELDVLPNWTDIGDNIALRRWTDGGSHGE